MLITLLIQLHIPLQCPGPVVCLLAFRTLKEGLMLASHAPGTTAASVWTEDLTGRLAQNISQDIFYDSMEFYK